VVTAPLVPLVPVPIAPDTPVTPVVPAPLVMGAVLLEHPTAVWLTLRTDAALDETGPAEAIKLPKRPAPMATNVAMEARLKRFCISVSFRSWSRCLVLNECGSSAAKRKTGQLAGRRMPQIEEKSWTLATHEDQSNGH
jgi:hypothetical protein